MNISFHNAVLNFNFVTAVLCDTFLQMKHKPELPGSEAGSGGTGPGPGSCFAAPKPIKEGLVSQIASKFQQVPDTAAEKTTLTNMASSSTRTKKTSDSILYTSSASKKEAILPPVKKTSSVSRTESHQARFNSARAMFEKMGSADDLDSISSGGGGAPGNNRGSSSRASSVQRSRSTSPFNSKVNSQQPPRSPETPEAVSVIPLCVS